MVLLSPMSDQVSFVDLGLKEATIWVRVQAYEALTR